MALTLPNLDDRSYADLVEEAKALIPVFAPEWTNHNASDPGITLLELFAWLTEMLIYRTNRVPEQHLIAFLRLLKGDSQWQPGEALDAEVREMLTALGCVYRAVTSADYEQLAIELGQPHVARAKCVPRRNLKGDGGADAPGVVSVIVLPQSGTQSGVQRDTPADVANDEPIDIGNIERLLQQRSLIATKVHVVEPAFVPVSADILIRPHDGFAASELPQAVVEEIARFLDPFAGGTRGAGWPFGRNIYVSDLYHLLENVPRLDFVVDILLFSRDSLNRVLWHEDGGLIGLRLAENDLPRAEIESRRVFVARDVTPVQVIAQVKPASSIAPPALRQVRGAVQVAVKRAFLPKADEPLAGLTVSKARISESINEIAGGLVESITAITMTQGDNSPRETVTLADNQLADVRVTVNLSENP